MRASPTLAAGTFFLAAATLVTVSPRSAEAQSFNCRQAQTTDERVICRRPGLSRLDERMSRKYYRTRDRVGANLRRLLEEEQEAWLRSRHRCGDGVPCIRRHYRTRIAEIDAFSERARRFDDRRAERRDRY